MTDTKRQNFNITPEQEAEIAYLKEMINASTTKDAILSAVRFYSVMAARVKEGQEIYITDKQTNQMERVVIPDMEALKQPQYRYLVAHSHPWRRQLFVKGRRLPAASVYKDYLVEHRTPAQLANDWSLPLEAVTECIMYCKENQALLEMEAQEDRRRAERKGYKF